MLNAPRKAYTVYSAAESLSGLPAVLRGVRGDIVTTPNDCCWMEISVRFPTSALSISHKEYVEGGDEFSKIMLGTLNYLRSPNRAFDEVRRNAVVARIKRATFLMGIVAEPVMREEHLPIVRAVAASTDGVIFDGSNMLDPDELVRVE